MNVPVTTMIPGISDIETVGIFAIGTGLFVFAMWNLYKNLKRKRLSKTKPTP